MSKERIQELIEKYLSGSLTSVEKNELWHWYTTQEELAIEDPSLTEKEKRDLKNEIWEKIAQQIGDKDVNSRFLFFSDRFPSLKKLIKVAAIFLLMTGGILFYVLKNQIHQREERLTSIQTGQIDDDIRPGKNGATLHLSNGQTINLDSLKNGAVVKQGDVEIIKEKDQIRYVGKSNETVYNDVTTARGQQWQLTLPDGTKVWLNAESSIHYPLSFNGNERIVTVCGEAYFEVVHDEHRPFRVKAGNTLIDDLGTKFNVNAYNNETVTKTTLVQGSVAVSIGNNMKLLVPGQQAITNTTNSLDIRNVDIHSAVGWKNQEIVFDNKDFQSIMREVERWYNIKIIYQVKPPILQFSGSMSSTLNLSQFLKILDFENVHYTLEGRKLTIN